MDIELVRKYRQGSTSPDEDKEIVRWLEESAANRTMFAGMMALDSQSSPQPSDEVTERMISRLNARIDAEEIPQRRRIPAWTGWAAAAVCLLVAGFVAMKPQFAGSEKARTAWSEPVSNQTSNIRLVSLSDGTKVYLTPGSSVRQKMEADSRELELTGEAYFNVTRDTLRPMRVSAGPIKVEVLGTSFSLKNGGGIADTDVILEKGSVRILSSDGQKLFNLKPNQKATVLSSTGDVIVEEMLAIPYIIEKYNLVSVVNADIREVVELIENNYGVKISFSPEGDGALYDINFLKTDALKDVIEIVEYVSGCHLTVAAR
ncbi:MAG: FecR domain-containing protein [Bacteroidales bacterium]|nr:FecR domain-containing protein [Bacteroidales bacterium]